MGVYKSKKMMYNVLKMIYNARDVKNSTLWGDGLMGIFTWKCRRFLSILLLFALIICAPDLKLKADAKNDEAPMVIKAQMINDTDMELYWNQEVTGADDELNFIITVDGKEDKIYSYTWEDYNYTEKGIVYYNPKSSENPDGSDTPKTSIRLTDPIEDPNNLPDIKVTVSGGSIKGESGIYAPEQVITVDTYEPFYQQEIVMDCGVRILGSKNVRPEAMSKAEEMLEVILANEQIADRMGNFGCMLGLYGNGEIAYDIPEHRFEYDEAYLYVEGFGGTQLASIKDANVLRLTTGDYTTGYTDESILTHEFAHTVKNYGLTEAQQRRVETVYADAVGSGKWANSYAGSNPDEYFATITAMWFNAMDDTWDGQWDGVRGPINTRNELKVYDKEAYDMLSEIYVSDVYLPQPWENGSVPNNYVYPGSEPEPTAAPTEEPTKEPTKEPAKEPTAAPTEEPTKEPTADPTEEPAKEPAAAPTKEPAETPSAEPQKDPGASQANTPEPVKAPENEPAQITVKKTSISVLKLKKGGKVFIKVKKVKGAKGYRITYTGNKGFKKGVKSKYIKKNKCTIKKVKKGICYFRAEAYKTDSYGNKIYGEVGKTRKINIKNHN